MQKQYQNQNVSEVRDAQDGDPGFDVNKDQVIVRTENGAEKTVLRSDVKTTA